MYFEDNQETKDAGMSVEEANRRYAGIRKRLDTGEIGPQEFDDELKQLMVRDEEGRWWAKSRSTGEWHYRDGASWVPGTPPVGRKKEEAEPPGKELNPLTRGLAKICASQEGKIPRLHVGESIPPRKLNSARDAFRIPPSEDVLALYDGTVKRSGNHGFAVCETGLYLLNESVRPSSPGRIAWSNFAGKPIELRARFFTGEQRIHFGPGNSISPMYDDRLSLVRLFRSIQSFLVVRMAAENTEEMA